MDGGLGKEAIKRTLERCGKETIIYPWCRIAKPEVVSIGDWCKIDDFVFIFGGEGVIIKDHTHLASHSVIGGGGKIKIGNHVGISWGVKIATGTNHDKFGKHMTAAAPLEEQGFYHGEIIIEDDVIIFANAVIVAKDGEPLVIGEGAVIGALSLVNKDVEPWSVNVGVPCKKIRERKPLLEELRK